jgi:hypothetical protein
MNANRSAGLHWYVDVRAANSTEQMSLDLTRHLPRRLSVGPAVIVTDRPAVMLSVVRKRWMKIVREVALQHASTLDPSKKAGLQLELDHLRSRRFTFKTFRELPTADCFFICPTQLREALPPYYPTLYITTWLSAESLLAAVSNLPLRGLIVIYGERHEEYEALLLHAFHRRLQQYGEGSYPSSASA